MKAERENFIKDDPKVMKRKVKKNTYARGNMHDKGDDGRDSACQDEDMIFIETQPKEDRASSIESKSKRGGGTCKTKKSNKR